MSREEINKVWKKREEAFERLEYYQTQNEGFFNTRNYNPHIKRAVKRIHALNEILYREEKIDRRKNAL